MTDSLIRGCKNTIIPNTVKIIGEQAFSGCQGLSAIDISESVQRISPHAFVLSTLSSIVIPNSVQEIGEDAFWGCSNLSSVSIGNSVDITRRIFNNCTSLPIENNIRYADTYLIETTDKTLSTYQIKEGTKWINEKAFADCNNLSTINLPKSLKRIQVEAFANCSNLTTITFPDSLISIGESAFNNCISLEEIELPKQITRIEYSTFGNCSNLSQIKLPQSLATIEYFAFSGCSNLKSLIIPNRVSTIGRHAFSGCSGLTTITCLNYTPPTIDSETFSGVSKDIPLYVPEEAVSAYQSAEYWKEFTHILPLLVEVKSVSPDTAQLTWMPVDSASMYRLHIYAESITFDTTLVINADNTNGGTIASEAPNRQKIKHIVLDDIGTIIVITIDPQSGSSVTQPFIVTVSTNTTNEIDFRFEMTVLSGNDTIRSEEGFFTLNEELKTAIQSIDIGNTSNLQFGIYDLYGHRYPAEQYPNLPAGIYIIREKDEVKKVIKE